MDLNAFKEEEFHPRVAGVEVPALAKWLGEGAKWEVRGLTYEELARAEQAAEKPSQLTALVNAFAGMDKKAIPSAVKDLLGYGTDSPPQLIKRVQFLTIASVDPPCDEAAAVKLASTFPVEFKQLTDKVLELTGKGYQPGKPQSSGQETT